MIEVLSPMLIEQNMALTFQKVRIFQEIPQVEIITMHQSSSKNTVISQGGFYASGDKFIRKLFSTCRSFPEF